VVAPGVMVAQLSGAVRTKVAVIEEKGKFFVKSPKELGGKVEAVPADTLTDCINYKTWEWNQELKGKKIAGKDYGEKKA
jgi:hypothetical protein